MLIGHLPRVTYHGVYLSIRRLIAQPTETKVGSGTFQIKRGTSVNLSNSRLFAGWARTVRSLKLEWKYSWTCGKSTLEPLEWRYNFTAVPTYKSDVPYEVRLPVFITFQGFVALHILIFWLEQYHYRLEQYHFGLNNIIGQFLPPIKGYGALHCRFWLGLCQIKLHVIVNLGWQQVVIPSVDIAFSSEQIREQTAPLQL